MSPKEKFRGNSDLVKGYNDLIDSRQMQSAFDAALLEFHYRMSLPSDMASASANEWRRQGAKQFLDILLGLNTVQVPEKKTDSKALNYKA